MQKILNVNIVQGILETFKEEYHIIEVGLQAPAPYYVFIVVILVDIDWIIVLIMITAG